MLLTVSRRETMQEGDDGVDHPVSYYLKKCSRHQVMYSTIEKEVLALVLALIHFEVYVGSSVASVTVFMDHNLLVFIHQMKNTNQRLMCWALSLQNFDVVIHHVIARRIFIMNILLLTRYPQSGVRRSTAWLAGVSSTFIFLLARTSLPSLFDSHYVFVISMLQTHRATYCCWRP